MAGTVWIPGAERLRASMPGGTITSTAPPRVVWHTVEAPSGDPRMWTRMQEVLTSKSAEPNVLYDPVTDRLGQFLALDSSGRALRNDGTNRTNRTGEVCIQIEVIAYAAKPFTNYWKPGPNFRALMAAIRSWGIPDAWPSGPPPKFIADPPHNEPEDERSRTIWASKGGHYGHCHVPGNNHGDPGGISTSTLFAAAKPTTTSTGDDMALTDADVQKILNTELGTLDYLGRPLTVGQALREASADFKISRIVAASLAEGGELNEQLDRIEADLDAVGKA